MKMENHIAGVSFLIWQMLNRGDGYGSIEMDCNSLECIYGDFYSLVFQRIALEEREGSNSRIWCYGNHVYSGFATDMEVTD